MYTHYTTPFGVRKCLWGELFEKSLPQFFICTDFFAKYASYLPETLDKSGFLMYNQCILFVKHEYLFKEFCGANE